jgi:anti-sigma B factor antagonist
VTADALPVIELRATALAGAAGIAVRGEVDLSTGPLVEEALDAAIRGSAGSFVLDLSGVEFLDSSGVGVLLRARALLGRDDRALVVVCPEGQVRRVLELVGIDDLFALHGSREEAGRALRR